MIPLGDISPSPAIKCSAPLHSTGSTNALFTTNSRFLRINWTCTRFPKGWLQRIHPFLGTAAAFTGLRVSVFLGYSKNGGHYLLPKHCLISWGLGVTQELAKHALAIPLPCRQSALLCCFSSWKQLFQHSHQWSSPTVPSGEPAEGKQGLPKSVFFQPAESHVTVSFFDLCLIPLSDFL